MEITLGQTVSVLIQAQMFRQISSLGARSNSKATLTSGANVPYYIECKSLKNKISKFHIFIK